MLKSLIKSVENWFEKEGGGGLVLPDGWFGRPYDNQHTLSAIEQIDERLCITLDRRVKLHFEGLQGVKVTREELVLGPFKKLQFEWVPYGNAAQKEGSRRVEYKDGYVRIVSKP